MISKTITKRLSSVLNVIIHEDQTCSVKGRTILDNVHLMRNIIDYVDQKNMECVFLNLNFRRVTYPNLGKWPTLRPYTKKVLKLMLQTIGPYP